MRVADYACWSPSGDRLIEGPAAAGHTADLPATGAITVPGFDTAVQVGPKGIRSMDRATAFAVATAGRLLRADDADRTRTGLVIATTAGSFKTVTAFQTDALTRSKPHLVDPGQIPVTVMNYAAGQVAIRHGITGPNATIRGGRTAMAQALRYARRLLDSGRVDQVLCGATEEATPERAWLEHAARPPGATAVPIGEGSVMLRLLPDGEPGPRIAAVAAQLAAPDPAAALEGSIRRALADSGIASGEVAAVAATAAPDGHGESEAHALQAVLGRHPAPVRIHERIGDTSAATLGFALLSVLDTAEPGTAFALTAIDRAGLACCVLGRT